MSKETLDFLKELQKEMNEQETDCQAHPRYWVVAQYEWVSCWENSAEKNIIYCPELEGEFESFESLMDELVEQEYFSQEIFDEIATIDDLSEHLDAYEVPMKNIHTVKTDSMFLTKRECQEHIRRNHHHYNNTVHTYAMTAWRSPQVEKLYNILMNENWGATNDTNN